MNKLIAYLFRKSWKRCLPEYFIQERFEDAREPMAFEDEQYV